MEGNFATLAPETDDGGNPVVSFILTKSSPCIFFRGQSNGDKGSTQSFALGFELYVVAFDFDLVRREKFEDRWMPARAGDVLVSDGEPAHLQRGIPRVEVMGPDQGKDTIEGKVIGAAQFGVVGVTIQLAD